MDISALTIYTEGSKYTYNTSKTCGSRFFSGVRGRSDGQKTVWIAFFLSPQLIYSLQRGSNGIITVNTILFQGFKGGPTFSRGGGGGSKC